MEEKDFCGIRMVRIPPGEFMMGTANGKYYYERPRHRVTFERGFWLGKYPVTQAQWKSVMGNNPSYFQSAGDDAPVESVSRDDCQAFCAKTGLRLPSEAEWEYACRAGDGKRGKINDVAWYARNSGFTTHPVGQKFPNAWGLHDMLGNVWEWCADDWHGNYNGAPRDGSSWFAAPRGSYCVARGGSWGNGAGSCRPAYRICHGPGYRGNGIGFRVARSL